MRSESQTPTDITQTRIFHLLSNVENFKQVTTSSIYIMEEKVNQIAGHNQLLILISTDLNTLIMLTLWLMKPILSLK